MGNNNKKMPAVLSKNLNPKKLVNSLGVPIRDENGSLDLHCWCEDDDGNVIFDPYFPEYELVKQINRCEGDPLRCEEPDWMIFINENRCEEKSQMMTWTWENPVFRQCIMNSYDYWVNHDNAKMVVGRFGWKKKSGGIHWEFG